MGAAPGVSEIAPSGTWLTTRPPARYLFVLVLLLTLCVDWAYSRALPEDFAQRLVAELVVDAQQAEMQQLNVERGQAWAVVLAPVIILGVASFWALVFQLGFALTNQQVAFRDLIRLTLVGHLWIVANGAVDGLFRLELFEGVLNAELFYASTGQLTSYVDSTTVPGLVRSALRVISWYEIGWYGTVLYGLIRIGRSVSRTAAIGIAVFALFNLLQWALILYIRALLT